MSEAPDDRAPRPNLYGMAREELAERFEALGAPRFHGGQAYRWLYARRRFDVREWTDVSRELRETLAAATTVEPGTIAERIGPTDDGTIKYRIEPAGGGTIETVAMVHDGRSTLCVSSQVGCALDCDFCLTAQMGFVRHLDAGEIAGQVALVQHDRGLTAPFNVVFMGMGEPFHNYDHVMAAVRLLTDDDGFALSRRRLTVSTSGLVPAIRRLAGEPVRPRLAVSLNATDDAVRDRIMPINRKYPIEALVEACREYVERTGERITFEYVLLDGVNDRDEDVPRLARLARRVRAKLNLIPHNTVEGWLDYRPPPDERIERFRDRLLAADVPVSVRWSKGRDARAACGQLAVLGDGGRRRPRRGAAR